VTDNHRDFERIARVAPFDFVGPWPMPRRPPPLTWSRALSQYGMSTGVFRRVK